jgi:peroxiredoxin
LSDPDLAVIKQWGIVNQDRPTVPHPTAVVVDSDGVVQYLRVDVDYTKRPPVTELLGALDQNR